MIPDETIEHFIKVMGFGEAEPGAALHHLLIATSRPEDLTPLGQPDRDELAVDFSVIAPVGNVDSEDLVHATIIQAGGRLREAGRTVRFAALTMEVNLAPYDDQARKLDRTRSVSKHPKAYEATILYAACDDGRRWHGTHYVTGPRAGQTDEPTAHDGHVRADEQRTQHRLIRALVGLGPVQL